ncbi:MAG: SIS domain-containing protein [Acidobacteriota bacterium]|nr:SIS domain-containing protein [Acidobacteriota bacterium]
MQSNRRRLDEGEFPVDIKSYVAAYKKNSLRVLEGVPDDLVADLASRLESARRNGRQIFVCGNGGSAASASHLANDLGKGASYGRSPRFRVLSLTDNIPWISAVANDYDYDQVFVEQLRNYGRSGDLLLAFSGSGNSPNVINAVGWANRNGIATVGITGRSGGKLSQCARHVIRVDSSHMGHIEEAHFLILHLVSYFFMETPEDPGR